MFFYIFFFKILENSLSTLRIIVISHGKKILGAFLNFIIALIWIGVTSVTVINVKDNFSLVIAFALGSLLGSYIGSILEEKIALGSNALLALVDNKYLKILEKKLNNNIMTKINSNNKTLLIITVKRKNTNKIVKIIKKYDSKSIIFSEKINIFSTPF